MKPPIICLCGSLKFADVWRANHTFLTHCGCIVLGVGAGYMSGELPVADGDLKKRLDALHFRKIDLCDFVLVINKEGYMGNSTRREINYANSIGKSVFYITAKEGKKDGTKVSPLRGPLGRENDDCRGSAGPDGSDVDEAIHGESGERTQRSFVRCRHYTTGMSRVKCLTCETKREQVQEPPS